MLRSRTSSLQFQTKKERENSFGVGFLGSLLHVIAACPTRAGIRALDVVDTSANAGGGSAGTAAAGEVAKSTIIIVPALAFGRGDA